ncbi:uncharacterized protein LOC131931926 [Physella acuta]|uniref:uncharacterized protein LOC131931926 n=1 Tax=Physella acuta TaxID=109671 RepID=UPI0027DBD32D|nr:uncharacterized protein LOC131931926 [Physella acuta]
MDYSDARSRLHYVTELLQDLRHYHHTNTHACSCDVCCKKQALLRSSIARALEEVCAVRLTLENNHASAGVNTYELNNEAAASLSLNTSQRQSSFVHPDVERPEAKHGSNLNSTNITANFYPNTCREKNGQVNAEENESSPLLCSTQRDSGLHSSLNSQSISPILNSEELQAKEMHSPHQNLYCKTPNHNVSGTFDSNGSNNHSARHHLPPFSLNGRPDSSHLGPANVPTNFYQPAVATPPFPNPFRSPSCFQQPSYPTSPWPNFEPGTPSAMAHSNWMPNMFLPFPFMPFLPSPNFVQELEKCRRFSENFFINSNMTPPENQNDRKNQTFSSYINTPTTPMDFRNSYNPHAFTPSTMTENTPCVNRDYIHQQTKYPSSVTQVDKVIMHNNVDVNSDKKEDIKLEDNTSLILKPNSHQDIQTEVALSINGLEGGMSKMGLNDIRNSVPAVEEIKTDSCFSDRLDHAENEDIDGLDDVKHLSGDEAICTLNKSTAGLYEADSLDCSKDSMRKQCQIKDIIKELMSLETEDEGSLYSSEEQSDSGGEDLDTSWNSDANKGNDRLTEVENINDVISSDDEILVNTSATALQVIQNCDVDAIHNGQVEKGCTGNTCKQVGSYLLEAEESQHEKMADSGKQDAEKVIKQTTSYKSVNRVKGSKSLSVSPKLHQRTSVEKRVGNPGNGNTFSQSYEMPVNKSIRKTSATKAEIHVATSKLKCVSNVELSPKAITNKSPPIASPQNRNSKVRNADNKENTTSTVKVSPKKSRSPVLSPSVNPSNRNNNTTISNHSPKLQTQAKNSDVKKISLGAKKADLSKAHSGNSVACVSPVISLGKATDSVKVQGLNVQQGRENLKLTKPLTVDKRMEKINSLPTITKSVQWGAPAEDYYHISTEAKNTKNISISESKKISWLEGDILTSSDSPNLHVLPKKDDLTCDPLLSQKTTNISTPSSGKKLLISRAKTEGYIKGSLKDKTRPSTQVGKSTKSNSVLHQTLPVYGSEQSEQRISHTPFSESFEANQSFPKMAKTLPTVPDKNSVRLSTPAGQDVVTNLHQISTPKPELTPRNRRSIYGLSPPDTQLAQKNQDKSYDKGRDVSDEDSSFTRNKSLCDPSADGYLDMLWAQLDVLAEIGQVPTLQEVLFNCVTSLICVVDPHHGGKIVTLNESFQYFIGFHEKIVGQRLFRFIKIKDPLDNLGVLLPQPFVFADGRSALVCGKLVSCINGKGEEVPVSIWTVPYAPQPKLTLCVMGNIETLSADVYLNDMGHVLLYSPSFEDFIGVSDIFNQNTEDPICQITDVDFSKINTPQRTTLEALNCCRIPVTVVLADSKDEVVVEGEEASDTIYPAALSLSVNNSGLVCVQADGLIEFSDQNYFRIYLGYVDITKRHISEFLIEVIRMSEFKPDEPSASSDISWPIHEMKNTDVEITDDETEDLILPASCFFDTSSWKKYWVSRDLDNTSICETSVVVDDVDQETKCLTLPVPALHLEPHQTSTPCKHSSSSVQLKTAEPEHSVSQPEKVRIKNGIYIANLLHANGSKISVTVKLGSIRTSAKTSLFCLWFYVDGPVEEEDLPSDDEKEDLDDSQEDDVAEASCDEEELRHRLKHLRFDQSIDKTVDPSLGQLIAEQAGLNQSHNANPSEDMLDLEAAMAGKFSQKFTVCEALGQGSFGFVRRAKSIKSNKSYVVKFIKKSKMFDDSWTYDKIAQKNVNLEVAILKQTDYEYIIKVIAVYENTHFVQMVMEDFGEIDLFDLIDQISIDEPLASYLFRQIIWAVEYLHSKDIIHRDIKDENVVVNSEFQCKLIDFGSAIFMLPNGKKFTKFRGTMEYCSPEVYNGEGYYGPEVDMWALGVTLYTIVFRENPFTVDTEPCQLCPDDLPFDVSQDLMTLMLGLLKTNPKRRYTMLQAVSSNWLRQIVDMSQYSWETMLGYKYDQVDVEN